MQNVTNNAFDAAPRERCRWSLERSAVRRQRSRRIRRRRLRTRGGVLSLAAVTLCVAVAGAGLATAGSPSAIGKGDRGPSVVKLQKKLRLPADGIFGRETERAVVRFQRGRGLPADGVVGPDTARALGLGMLRTAGRRTTRSGSGGTTVERRPSRSVTLPAELVRIAECESGGNPRAVSRSGQYRGKFQFDVGTWRGLGG